MNEITKIGHQIKTSSHNRIERAEKRYDAHKHSHVVRLLLRIASVLSLITRPFYLPLVGLIALFVFSYLSMLPFLYKVQVLLLTYIFTILLPTMLIRLYQRYQGWSIMHLFSQEGRMIPYVISIACYFGCFYVMNFMQMPYIISAIIVAALFVQIICAVLNVWWKISTHMAAIGGITGGLMAFAEIFSFNPLWWLCFSLVISGLVGTSRMVLRVHTLPQVVYGYLVGIFTTFMVVVML